MEDGYTRIDISDETLRGLLKPVSDEIVKIVRAAHPEELTVNTLDGIALTIMIKFLQKTLGPDHMRWEDAILNVGDAKQIVPEIVSDDGQHAVLSMPISGLMNDMIPVIRKWAAVIRKSDKNMPMEVAEITAASLISKVLSDKIERMGASVENVEMTESPPARKLDS